MLEQLKKIENKMLFLKGEFGIEREALRTLPTGKLAKTMHPAVFGDKLRNPYITTDFSESQLELITPVCSTSEEAYHFIGALYDIVAQEIMPEYIWPGSMPCDIPKEQDIPIAIYGEDEEHKNARTYREKLFEKYGGKKQLISGIHVNFSFKEELIKQLYHRADKKIDFTTYKNNLYLKITRNFLRYRWFIVYLMGATPVMHHSYAGECSKYASTIGSDGYTMEGCISYRNGQCGYKNIIDLYPDYCTLDAYIESIENFVSQNILESHKELYTPIRLKGKDNHHLLESLKTNGVQYIEIRNIDINPFDKVGITIEQLEFLNLFFIYLLIEEETDYQNWQKEGNKNQMDIAKQGHLDIKLLKDGVLINKNAWVEDIFEKISAVNNVLKLGKEDILEYMRESTIYGKRNIVTHIKEEVAKKGYLETHLALAKNYQQEAYFHRYKMQGMEKLELSTQLLIKEAVKQGIKVELVDRQDNFIKLIKGKNIQYVKQATKTSKDSYITMLMMENKTVTKKILAEHAICVPKGVEWTKQMQNSYDVKQYEYIPCVIKPKSTNFGTGISIFPDGASYEDLQTAIKLAFSYDDTVLIEEFAKGKEYRFLVIEEKVCGILHRVPANIKGDGKHTIRELVEKKNKDPLRGKGYKTPLEKIQLDTSSSLFLKQQGLDFDSIVEKGRIVYLRENSNISTGGDSIDYTDSIPKRFKDIAIACSKAVGAHICGVDMMLENYQSEDSKYAIIELNFNPAIHIHCYPYEGKERNIAKDLLLLLGY